MIARYFLCVEFSDFYVNQSLAGQTILQYYTRSCLLCVCFIHRSFRKPFLEGETCFGSYFQIVKKNMKK
jgi:hypothetical protein